MRTKRIAALLLAALLFLPTLATALPGPGPRYMLLGRYPADKDGAEAPILWLVLKDDAEGVLLLSAQVLEVMPVHSGGRFNGYEYSDLKNWLEGGFVEAAFSPQEQALLMKTEGKPAVTLPSVEELRKKDGGFFEPEELGASPTAHAIARGVQRYGSGEATYWTRNRATSNPDGQRRVMDKGSFGYAIASYTNIGVRPMMTLNPGALAGAQGAGSAEGPLMPVLPEVAAQEGDQPGTAETAQEGDQPGTAEAAQEGDQPGAEAAGEQAAAGPGSAPAGAPLMTEGFPELTPEGFLPEGQEPYVFKDEENGVWRYASPTLRLVINRRQDVAQKLRWFETHIFFPEGESLQMYPLDENNRRRMGPMEKIADQHNLVYAMNGDYYAYRVDRDRRSEQGVAIGRVARGFKLLYDEAVSEKRKAHPNLDIMALYPDGSMTVHAANETTAQALLDAGARDVLCFGPWLVRDGEINVQGVSNFGVTQQPRAGLGMVGKGHFLHIVVESRTSRSRGVNTTWLAERFVALQCPTAFNLDGGQTAVLIFMGEQLNEIGKYDNKTNSRLQNEVMGIGQR